MASPSIKFSSTRRSYAPFTPEPVGIVRDVGSSRAQLQDSRWSSLRKRKRSPSSDGSTASFEVVEPPHLRNVSSFGGESSTDGGRKLRDIILDTAGDLCVTIEDDSTTINVLVDSRCLRRVSLEWRHTVDPSQAQLFIQAEDGNDVLTLLRIAHSTFEEVPERLSYPGLLRYTSLCAQYGLVEMVRPFLRSWVWPWHAHALRPGHESFIFVAWVFGYRETFQTMTWRLAATITPNEFDLNGFLGDRPSNSQVEAVRSIIDNIMRIRSRLFQDIASLCQTFIHDLSTSGRKRCKSNGNSHIICDAIGLGSLIQGLNAADLSILPTLTDPTSITVSVQKLIVKLGEIRILTHPTHRHCDVDEEFHESLLLCLRFERAFGNVEDLDVLGDYHRAHFASFKSRTVSESVMAWKSSAAMRMGFVETDAFGLEEERTSGRLKIAGDYNEHLSDDSDYDDSWNEEDEGADSVSSSEEEEGESAGKDIMFEFTSETDGDEMGIEDHNPRGNTVHTDELEQNVAVEAATYQPPTTSSDDEESLSEQPSTSIDTPVSEKSPSPPRRKRFQLDKDRFHGGPHQRQLMAYLNTIKGRPGQDQTVPCISCQRDDSIAKDGTGVGCRLFCPNPGSLIPGPKCNWCEFKSRRHEFPRINEGRVISSGARRQASDVEYGNVDNFASTGLGQLNENEGYANRMAHLTATNSGFGQDHESPGVEERGLEVSRIHSQAPDLDNTDTEEVNTVVPSNSSLEGDFDNREVKAEAVGSDDDSRSGYAASGDFISAEGQHDGESTIQSSESAVVISGLPSADDHRKFIENYLRTNPNKFALGDPRRMARAHAHAINGAYGQDQEVACLPCQKDPRISRNGSGGDVGCRSYHVNFFRGKRLGSKCNWCRTKQTPCSFKYNYQRSRPFASPSGPLSSQQHHIDFSSYLLLFTQCSPNVQRSKAHVYAINGRYGQDQAVPCAACQDEVGEGEIKCRRYHEALISQRETSGYKLGYKLGFKCNRCREKRTSCTQQLPDKVSRLSRVELSR